MPNLLAPCQALAVLASSALAPGALDRAQLFSPLSQPLAGASHG